MMKSYFDTGSYVILDSVFVNSCVPKTVRHGTSLHIICPKLLIDSSPSRMESQKSVCQLLGKHWRDTSVGAHFQCSQGSDTDLLVESQIMEFHVAVCQVSSN